MPLILFTLPPGGLADNDPYPQAYSPLLYIQPNPCPAYHLEPLPHLPKKYI
jgi:hypothetical protein